MHTAVLGRIQDLSKADNTKVSPLSRSNMSFTTDGPGANIESVILIIQRAMIVPLTHASHKISPLGVTSLLLSVHYPTKLVLSLSKRLEAR